MTYQQPVAPTPMSDADQRLWATLIHVGSLFLAIWSPLIGFLILKDRGAFVRHHAAQSLNFQLTMIIVSLAIGILGIATLGIGFILYFAIGVLMIIFPILAAVAANRGELYRYPLTIQFLR